MYDSTWKRELLPKREYQGQGKNASVYTMKRGEEESNSLRIERLMNRLKSAGNQSTIQLSHLTNSMTRLKDSKSVLFNRFNPLEDFRGRVSRLCPDQSENIMELEEVVNLLLYRQREEASCEGRQNIVKTEVQKLENMLEQIKLKIAVKPTRKVFGPFQEIFQTPVNLKTSAVANDRSRKETVNSILRDGSLLLSFKKNLQEDDGCATLKYSEQSNQRGQQKDIQAKEVKAEKRYNRKITEKQEEMESSPEPTQQDLKYRIKGFEELQSTKTAISIKKKQIQSAFTTYEQLLQKFIEAIAQEKVQSEQSWKRMTTQTREDILSMKQAMSQLRSSSQASTLSFQQKCLEISQTLADQLRLQRHSRQEQQKRMIRTMLKVVSYFQ